MSLTLPYQIDTIVLSTDLFHLNNRLNQEEKKMKKVVTVDGMMCMHCVAHVKDALSKVEGVSDVVVSLDEKTATLNCTENVTDQMLSDAVTNAGYTVISVK